MVAPLAVGRGEASGRRQPLPGMRVWYRAAGRHGGGGDS